MIAEFFRRALLLGGPVGLALATLGDRAYAHLPVLHVAEDHGSIPLSVIIPARDEAVNLSRLLPTLTGQGAADIIVVDDNSTDETADIARRYGARVIPAGPLPSGWTGKAWACHLGAAAASSPWLAFVDADVWLKPGALVSLLAAAESSGIDLGSVLLRQETGSFWEEVLLPFAFRHYFAGVAISPNEPILNGQLILARRDVYRQGGHAAPAVRGSIAEDIALARHHHQRGDRLQTWRAEHLASVRMYTSLAAIRAGFGKNSAAFVGATPRRGAATVIASVLAGATLLLAIDSARRNRRALPVTVALELIRLIETARWNRQFLGVSTPRAVLLAMLEPLGAAVFGGIALESLARTYLLGQLRWKGRNYDGTAGRWF